MPEARSDYRPRSALPTAPPRRASGVARPRPVDGRTTAVDPPWADAPSYPIDPPLVDVRIPVKAPHAAATAYSRAALMHRFPDAEVGDDLHMLFSESGQGRAEPAVAGRDGGPCRAAPQHPRRLRRRPAGGAGLRAGGAVAEHLEEGRGGASWTATSASACANACCSTQPARIWRGWARPCGDSR